MKKNTTLLRQFLSLFVLSFLSLTVFGQNQSSNDGRKKLTEDDYGKWERIGSRGTRLSNDGKWLIYPITRNNDKNELRFHDLSKDETTVIKNAKSHAFSGDSKWLGYLSSPNEKERKALRKKKKPIRNSLYLLNLSNGKSSRLKDIRSFSFSPDGKFLILKQYNEKKAKTKNNIVVRNLSTNKDYLFGNVDDYEWNDKGTLLAIVVETKNKLGNGIKVFDGNSTITLDSRKAVYNYLTWRKDSNDLAAFRSRDKSEFEESTKDILVWKDVSEANHVPKEFNHTKTRNFPKNMRVVHKSGLRWTMDGNSVFFDIDTWTQSSTTKSKKSSKKKPPIPALEIWNSSDVRTIPEQKRRANDTSHLSVWHVDSNKFIQLGDEELDDVDFQSDSKTLIAYDETPYDFRAMFGRPSYDVFSINIETGKKKKLLENVIYVQSVSPDGNLFVYLKDNHYHLYNFATDVDKNLTENLDASFVNLDDDHPVEQTRPYGFAGWDKTGSYFVAYSKYDIWKFDVKTGESTRLTDGKAEQIRNRFVRVNRASRYVDLGESTYVRMFGKWSKKSGYAKLVNGNSLQNIYWGDSLVNRLTVAKKADVAIFTVQKYNDSPDLFVSQNGSSNIKQVSNTNPFDNQYKIGKTELVEYVNANGKKLQGILYYPDDYKPGKKYPMITYIYELLSDNYHAYSTPSKGSYYNKRIFTSKGFFVFHPDILFDAGDPGVSSVKTLDIAVKAVVDKGDVDAKKVGLVGHSWGGYQTAFAVTRTNTFAAAVAGAGISNLITMYGSITPSFGNTFESRHFEVSQERMRVPPWEDIDGYIRNSAIPNIDKMQTPLLMEVGDADTNVNWRQGIEMYNAARRAKKEMVLLVYAKEGHGLRADKNRMDYQRRILEWFGHYLKGDPPKRWIKDNISYSEQKKLLKKRELE